MCKVDRRSKSVTKWTWTWKKIPQTSTLGKLTAEENWRHKKIWNAEFHGSKTPAALDGQELQSQPPTSSAAITGMARFPFTSINGLGLKIHLWLLSVGCWEKQKPIGRNGVWVFQICSQPRPFEIPEPVLWEKGIVLEDSALHLQII